MDGGIRDALIVDASHIRKRVSLPAPTPSRVECRHERRCILHLDGCPASRGNGIRSLLRLADCANCKPAGALGDMDGSGTSCGTTVPGWIRGNDVAGFSWIAKDGKAAIRTVRCRLGSILRRRPRQSVEITVQHYQSPPKKRRHAHFLSVAYSS